MSSTAASGPADALRPRRRELLLAGLAAVAAAGLAGCTSGADPDGETAPPPPAPDPDDALRESAAERERGLLREYDAVITALPALAARLAPVRAHHDAHLAALLAASSSPSAGASPTAGAPATGSPATGSPAPVVPPPADPAAALARLVAAERAAGTAHAQDCLAAASGALAGVLGALSASELSHPVALA